MKEYNFTTKKGSAVKLVTDISKERCFELRLTVAETQTENEKVCMFRDDNLLRYFSLGLNKRCGIYIPTDIAEEIRKEYHAACRNTDKIIIATIKDKDGRTIRECYGKPIIDPSFKLFYYMPEKMEAIVRYYAYDGKIYDMGGIEEECRECSREFLCCDESSGTTHYWMKHAEMKDPFNMEDFINQKVDKDYTLIEYDIYLKVVTPYNN